MGLLEMNSWGVTCGCHVGVQAGHACHACHAVRVLDPWRSNPNSRKIGRDRRRDDDVPLSYLVRSIQMPLMLSFALPRMLAPSPRRTAALARASERRDDKKWTRDYAALGPRRVGPWIRDAVRRWSDQYRGAVTPADTQEASEILSLLTRRVAFAFADAVPRDGCRELAVDRRRMRRESPCCPSTSVIPWVLAAIDRWRANHPDARDDEDADDDAERVLARACERAGVTRPGPGLSAHKHKEPLISVASIHVHVPARGCRERTRMYTQHTRG